MLNNYEIDARTDVRHTMSVDLTHESIKELPDLRELIQSWDDNIIALYDLCQKEEEK